MTTETQTPEVVLVAPTPTTTPATMAPSVVSAGQLIINRPTYAESMSMLKRTKMIGGMAIPEDMQNDAEGLDMLGGMVKPLCLRVCQAMSKELKAAGGFADGDAVVTPINVKVSDKANALDVIVLLAWAEYLCLNPRGCNLFWIRSRSVDNKSMEASKSRKFIKEVLPEGGMNPKTGQPWQIEYVKACNFLMWLPEHNVTVVATWKKGECKYGEAFSSLIQARGVSIYNSVYRLTVNERNNKDGDKWEGFNAGNSPTNNGWTPDDMKPAMAGLHAYYREQWSASNIDVSYDDMTEPQEATKVDTSEY